MWSLKGVLRSRRVREWVFFEVAVLGYSLPVRVPEYLVPDKWEGKSVKLSGDFCLDKNGKPVLRVTAIAGDAGSDHEGG